MVSQAFYLQKETTPGTAATTAMRRYHGIRFRPGWSVETQEFRAEGYKVNTASQVTSSQGTHTVEVHQDFNAFLPVLASVFNYDGVVQPDAVNAPTAYEHTFSLTADGADSLTTFTGIYGDATQAIEMVHLLFNSFSMGLERGNVTMSTSAFSRTPTTGATIPATGVTEVEAASMPLVNFDIFLDDDWASLGTTQADAVYGFDLNTGDKRSPSSAIDSRVASFATAIENEDIEFGGNIRVGFDADALALQTAFANSAQKFVRVLCTGPEIGTGVTYEFEVNMAVKIQRPGEISAAPNTPVVTLPFDYLIMPDTTSGNTLTARLVNTVATV